MAQWVDMPHHLLTLWNPSYAADAIDEHLAVLLDWAGRGPRVSLACGRPAKHSPVREPQWGQVVSLRLKEATCTVTPVSSRAPRYAEC